MSESLFSASWYRVAALRPRLRTHAVVHRHHYRGRLWYVLQDRSSGRFHRFTPVAHWIIGLMDGRRTVAEIWDLACARLGDEAPTQDEVISLLSTLHRADVLQTDRPPDMAELHQRQGRQARQRLRQMVQNPLSLRIPLLDPERLLRAVEPLARWLFGWPGALLWVAGALWAVVTAASHWSELSRDFTSEMLSAGNLALAAVVFPVAKLVHEFSHGLAVRARGGEVHEMGVMLLVFMPVPYVDASASLAFRSRADRMLVAAAGMLGELVFAMLALLVWVNVEPGLVKALAYNVMAVAGISTVVFNANPLLRFDGYYMLSDWLEIPNLGQRANAHLAWLVKRHLLRVADVRPGEATPGERRWFVAYGLAAFGYRLFVALSIALLVAQEYFVVGLLLALWSLYGSVVAPLVRQLGYLTGSPELAGRRARAVAIVASVLLIGGGALVWVPAPSWSTAEGVVVATEESRVRAGTDGFVVRIATANGSPVQRGQLLAEVDDPEAGARVRILEAQLREQEARRDAATRDRVQRSLVDEEIRHVSQRLAEARRRAGEVQARSQSDGIFVMQDPGDAPGRFLRRGELIGYVASPERLVLQVVVAQSDVDLVTKHTRRVELRRVEHLAQVLPARVRQAVPAATRELPSLALSAQGGGELLLDPASLESGRPSEARSADSVFLLELDVDPGEDSAARYIGSRVYVRFDHEPEPLGVQWFRAARRLLLERFDV